MNPLLRDLLDHQFWADAEMWKALGAHSAARDDRTIHDRLHHIHLVQRFFLWSLGDRTTQLTLTTPSEFPGFGDLEAYGRQTHGEFKAYLHALPASRLDERITLPHAIDPPMVVTVSEALMQVATHSHHHRAQNATRLRELGGVPPTLDLIMWYWKGRPVATW